MIFSVLLQILLVLLLVSQGIEQTGLDHQKVCQTWRRKMLMTTRKKRTSRSQNASPRLRLLRLRWRRDRRWRQRQKQAGHLRHLLGERPLTRTSTPQHINRCMLSQFLGCYTILAYRFSFCSKSDGFQKLDDFASKSLFSNAHVLQCVPLPTSLGRSYLYLAAQLGPWQLRHTSWESTWQTDLLGLPVLDDWNLPFREASWATCLQSWFLKYNVI